MELTQHFRENWIKRVGPPVPAACEVERMVAGSVIVQRFQTFTLRSGQYYKRLAIYWHPDCGVLLKIDEGKGRAVSVLSARCLEELRGD